MRSKEQLSHQEIMTSLSDCFRELMQTDIMDRKMPNIINRGKSASQIVTAMHREQVMEAKRQASQQLVISTQMKGKQLRAK